MLRDEGGTKFVSTTGPKLDSKAIDDGFRARQAPRQTGVVTQQLGTFVSLRVRFGRLRAALVRTQRADGASVAQSAPVGQGRGVDAFATQDGASTTGLGGAIGLGQDAQLVLRAEGPPARTIG